MMTLDLDTLYINFDWLKINFEINKNNQLYANKFKVKDTRRTITGLHVHTIPEALKSMYRSSGYKKNQLVLHVCKNYVLQW